MSERIVYNWFRYYDPATGRYTQSDPIGLDDGPNTYGYAQQNPLKYYDPNGKNAVTIPFRIGTAIGGGIARSPWGVRAIGWTVDGIFDLLNDDPLTQYNEISDLTDRLNERADGDSISVPYPSRKRGKYTCICRVQKDGRSPDNHSICDKNFGYGYGIADDLRTAKRQAEQMAKNILGAKSTHHPQCRCTGPTGNRIIPHG